MSAPLAVIMPAGSSASPRARTACRTQHMREGVCARACACKCVRVRASSCGGACPFPCHNMDHVKVPARQRQWGGGGGEVRGKAGWRRGGDVAAGGRDSDSASASESVSGGQRAGRGRRPQPPSPPRALWFLLSGEGRTPHPCPRLSASPGGEGPGPLPCLRGPPWQWREAGRLPLDPPDRHLKPHSFRVGIQPRRRLA